MKYVYKLFDNVAGEAMKSTQTFKKLLVDRGFSPDPAGGPYSAPHTR